MQLSTQWVWRDVFHYQVHDILSGLCSAFGLYQVFSCPIAAVCFGAGWEEQARIAIWFIISEF